MNDILNTRVATSPKRKLTITSIDKKLVTTSQGKTLDKIIMKTTETSTGKTFNISDSWTEDANGNKQVKGLWFSVVEGELNKSSTLAKVLAYYEADVLGDLLGKEVIAYPDHKDYLVLTACNMT